MSEEQSEGPSIQQGYFTPALPELIIQTIGWSGTSLERGTEGEEEASDQLPPDLPRVSLSHRGRDAASLGMRA